MATTMRGIVARHAVRWTRPHCRYASSQVPSTTPEESSLVPVNLQAAAKIEGEESQIATITLQPNQRLRAESGSMIYMTSGVEMETTASGASSAMKRYLTGQNLFVTDFSYKDDKEGTVALGTDFPSKILRLNLQEYPSQTLVCQKGAYLASNTSVDIELAFTKSFTSGFFGGEGFVLQKLTGEGDVLIKAGGTLVRKDLKEGETLRISSGSLVAFTSTVDYDVQMLSGFKNVMFGGEGLFVTTLKGPGTVWLQGMPPDRMVSEIVRRLPPGGLGFGIPIGMGGAGGGEEAGGDVEGEVPEGGAEEAVAATDAAVEADRQATVAASGADPHSHSALFGDAASEEQAAATSALEAETPDLQDEDSFGQDSWAQDETTFTDDTKMDDGFGQESFSTEDTFDEGGFQDDTSFSSGMDESVSETASEEGSSILSTLWDLFTGGDD